MCFIADYIRWLYDRGSFPLGFCLIIESAPIWNKAKTTIQWIIKWIEVLFIFISFNFSFLILCLSYENANFFGYALKKIKILQVAILQKEFNWVIVFSASWPTSLTGWKSLMTPFWWVWSWWVWSCCWENVSLMTPFCTLFC